MENLLKQAAVIRDEDAEYENSAERIGTLFVDVIQQMSKIVSDEQTKVDTLKVTANKSGVQLAFKVTDESGKTTDKIIKFPIVSKEKAGLLTPAILQGLDDKIVIHKFLTEDEYKQLKGSGKLDPNILYMIYEEE